MPRLSRLALLVLFVTGCSTAPVTPAPSAAASTSAPSSTSVQTPSPSPVDTEAPPSPSPSAVVYAPLDGLPGDASRIDRLPIAVMIDDNAVARPQAGFNAASIVYQAPADGGEDRYMLVFQEGDTATIGPVRSGRPYFVRWAAEYRAGFAHYGGDAKTLAYIPTINTSLIYNIDALFGAPGAFHRITTRSAPHNAYTSTAALWQMTARLGYPGSMVDGLAARPFKDDALPADRPASGSIRIPYGTGATDYAFDPASDTYLRSVAGRAQFDAADGQRVTAKDVVVLFMSLSIDPQSEPGHARPVLGQIGSGRALVFRDGTVVVGTWRKRDAGDLTRFVASDGQEIRLDRGRLFIQVVPIGTGVTYRAATGTP